MVHRNTYVNGPDVLRETWQVRTRPTLFFAGQMSGVEGYVESAASGLLAGLNAAALVRGEPVSAAPRTTAIGALAYYVSHADPRHYQPSNITFGIMPPLDRPPRGKMERKLALSKRALDDLAAGCERRAVRGTVRDRPRHGHGSGRDSVQRHGLQAVPEHDDRTARTRSFSSCA